MNKNINRYLGIVLSLPSQCAAKRISFLQSKYFKAKPFQLPKGKFHCAASAERISLPSECLYSA